MKIYRVTGTEHTLKLPLVGTCMAYLTNFWQRSTSTLEPAGSSSLVRYSRNTCNIRYNPYKINYRNFVRDTSK